MGKKSKSQSTSDSKAPASGSLPFLGGGAALDPNLSSLFDKSAGPVQAPAVKYVEFKPRKQVKETEDEDISEPDEDSAEEDAIMEDAPETTESDSADEKAAEIQSRKRKRSGREDDLEGSYMRRIAKEEQKAEDKRKAELAESQKQAKKDSKEEGSENEAAEDDSEADESEDDASAPVPVHESVTGSDKASEVEKSSRTVFLGNVSTQAIKSKTAKKTLLRHLASFCSTLREASGPHKVESIRFRSVPFASGGGTPKRASFARREILDETTPSTNAYAVYSTVQAARKAPAALNGTVVLDRHLRVDSVAHPAEIDHKRCVFVGNLDFVDQEGVTEDENGKKRKVRAPADIEEGLWRTFNANTGGSKDKKTSKKSVEFVRVIRDRNTRVGKGFAYVQFYDGNGVEEALLLNEKKFPPMLPRKLRVTRARKMGKKRDDSGGKDARAGDLAQKTLQGRANKLLGRAGAAQMKSESKGGIAGNSFVFEGHRASSNGSSTLKMKTKSRGSKGKPKDRSSKRAAAYRAAGGQKP
ncbi:Nucleolar protein 12 [Penicillium macrosclerotiorum]|uniref:Nucleolar protein 12 n=1 Tax=Penicillium macrosclerotiorum TaxID=303699 RepID=UPI0025476826|nr:Nucleolar protein 12 [Penicillium macrosclerotiorum]KAJ5675804.1 Nucleolar protein 12 [Penicillium macrosclerotiorum]